MRKSVSQADVRDRNTLQNGDLTTNLDEELVTTLRQILKQSYFKEAVQVGVN